jgi:hypothetical protein
MPEGILGAFLFKEKPPDKEALVKQTNKYSQSVLTVPVGE